MSALRWFPFSPYDGAYNMAADDVLLEAAVTQGLASLRFYGWTPATVSIGYFQRAAVLCEQTSLQQLPRVRRSSGGKTLVHHHELTYALTLPAGFQSGWMVRMHQRVILPALNRLGLAGKIEVVEKESDAAGEFLCFKQQTQGDLRCAGHKVVGSAQRKYRQALLQHGAILLASSEHAIQLPGLKELIGVELSLDQLQREILGAFQFETGWQVRQAQWSPDEENAIREKVLEQYGSSVWNEKR
jgi:lipoyl(octanoyl) transferase